MDESTGRPRVESEHLRATDLELLRESQQGDETAFRELVDRHASGLFRLGLALVGNTADAEDIVQETFLAAIQSMGAFRRRSSVKTWLYRILSKRAARCHRTRLRHAASTLYEDAEESALAIGGRARSSVSGATDTRLDVTEILEGLSTDHRQVIVLRELEGLAYAEIAELLRLPLGTVESRIARARKELRKRLDGYLR